MIAYGPAEIFELLGINQRSVSCNKNISSFFASMKDSLEKSSESVHLLQTWDPTISPLGLGPFVLTIGSSILHRHGSEFYTLTRTESSWPHL